MNPEYETFFTRKAYEDLRSIYQYIKEELQNTSSAIKMILKIALYTVNDQKKEVHIIRIFYGKRDYQELI